MGVVARILVFPNAEIKLDRFRILNELAEKGALEEYDSIHLYNKEYELNVKIRLLFKVSIQSKLQRDYISEIYKIDIDVPVEHDSLEGMFKVKERRDVELVHFTNPQIENIAIMTTKHRTATIASALKALNKYGFSPVESYVELPVGKRAVDILKELGNIGWVYVGEIPDAHLKGAGLHGVKLQNSEVLEDLVLRGGRIKAAIIEHRERDIKIVISEKGAIYSQKFVDTASMASIVMEVISVMLRHKMIRFKY
jgi:sorbitol-specific phosphotransferase system component IIA